MCNQSRLIYSPMYQINVDLEDSHCTSAKNSEFGKKLNFVRGPKGYMLRHVRGCKTLYMHRIIADACVPNVRRDLFNVVDHIDGDTKNNRVNNLRWVNNHLNMCNRQTRNGKTPPPRGWVLWREGANRGNGTPAYISQRTVVFWSHSERWRRLLILPMNSTLGILTGYTRRTWILHRMVSSAGCIGPKTRLVFRTSEKISVCVGEKFSQRENFSSSMLYLKN